MKKNQPINIGGKLPYGMQGKLSKITGFSQPYVCQFLKGRFDITTENACIIVEAKKMVYENSKKLKKILG